MFEVDAAFAAALERSHTEVARLSTLNADRSVRQSWESSEAISLAWGVDDDLTRAVRRSASISVVDETGGLSPHEAGDMLFTGERVRLETGILRGSTPTYVQMFEGIVTSFAGSMAGTLELAAEDPTSLLDQPFGEPVTIGDGMSAEDVVRLVAEPVLGSSETWSLDGGGRIVTLRTWAEDDRRLGSLVQLMHDLGLELFADRFGELVLRPRLDPTVAAAVTVVREFVPTAGLAAWLDLVRSGSDQPHNRFVVVSERPDQPTLRGIAEVTDPSSPIHRDRIGLRQADIYRLDTAAADQAAVNAVAQQMMIEDSLTLDTVRGTAMPDPRLDAGDVVQISEPRSGTDDRYRITRISHGPASMSLEAARVLPLALAESA